MKNETKDGKVFHKWVVKKGDVVLGDVYSLTTVFTMAEEVEVEAVYIVIMLLSLVGIGASIYYKKRKNSRN